MRFNLILQEQVLRRYTTLLLNMDSFKQYPDSLWKPCIIVTDQAAVDYIGQKFFQVISYIDKTYNHSTYWKALALK